ncbi:uncharacterized protein LOC134816584 [Bolinopsis microptera]|uniref:uncharacterized protein LOC134816584 n=1 Tax=Bolinopsis microptera TaxID=2820187 RepID=UPI00307B0FCF
MATVANGTGKRRALKKRPDTNERNRASMDGENTPVKDSDMMDLEFKKEFDEVMGYLENLPSKQRLILNNWLKKLKKASDETQELKNWREVRNEYIALMNNQLRRSDIIEPFTSRPQFGPLRPVPKKLAYTKMKFTLCADEESG